MIQITQAITELLKLPEFNLEIKVIQLKPVWNYLIFSGLTKHSLFRPHAGYFGSYQKLYMLDGDTPLIPGKELKAPINPMARCSSWLKTNSKRKNWNVNLDISGMYFPNILPLQTGIFGKNSEGLSASNTDPKEKASILDFVLVTSSVNAFSLLYLQDIHR